jgi:hypothetical protein
MTRATSQRALLIVDIINPLDFPGGDALQRQAIPAARRIAALKRRPKRTDSCASITSRRNAQALAVLRQSLDIDTRGSRRL